MTEGKGREAWDGLNTMMGRKVKKQGMKCDDPLTFANDLNLFYSRFDTTDFSKETEDICKPLLTVPNDLSISENDVKKVFSRLNPRKACGPDGLGGKVLKECSDVLSSVFCNLFQMLLNCHCVPRIWRTSSIIPVPKKPHAKIMNDFRPVALTSVLCKSLERIVCNQLTSSVAGRMDPLQFAYKAKRGVEDATLTLMELISHHLDQTGTFVRVLMMDFSSAFNTLQPHILLSRLIDLDVSPSMILWIREFLCDRPQTVNINGVKSKEIVLNTGAPQGCVLSPILFSIYTNEIMCNTSILTLIKFADDMALVARLKNEQSLCNYLDFIEYLISWFDKSFLKLNVQKTKEILFEEERAKDPSLLRPVQIKTEDVEKVENFKYLGTVLDSNLTFCAHVDLICKKANQRMYLVRKLKTFEVDKDILETIYRSLVESIIVFNIVTFYGHISVREKARLNRIVNIASKVVGKKQKCLNDLYQQSVIKKGKNIIDDVNHPLNRHFELLPSGRRLRTPKFRRQIYNKSFVPSAIRILNSGKLF